MNEISIPLTSRQAPRRKGEAIVVDGISKRFGNVPAVDAVDLEVEAGEFLSLLGPSGSGKTTLLMMLAGFETPSAGAITLNGRDLTFVPPNKRGIGMVFQRYALFPHMSVAQNVAFPLKMRKVPRHEIAGRVEKALSLVRLQDLAGRLPNQLSGGQQQRVAVARALVFEPPVLLMDEPLGALDKKLREELQIEIKTLHQEVGVTIIYVTHDQEEALTMSDRIAVMNRGRIEQLGTPRDLYHAPCNGFVADFIGKMNFIPATVAALGAESLSLAVGQTKLEVPRSCLRFERPVAGQPVRIAARPERIALEPGAEGKPGTLPGRVETSVFVGAHTTSILRLADGTPVHVQASGASVARGASVALRLLPESLHLFRAEG